MQNKKARHRHAYRSNNRISSFFSKNHKHSKSLRPRVICLSLANKRNLKPRTLCYFILFFRFFQRLFKNIKNIKIIYSSHNIMKVLSSRMRNIIVISYIIFNLYSNINKMMQCTENKQILMKEVMRYDRNYRGTFKKC